MSDYDDWCDECSAYGDDYYNNQNGELICKCLTCPFYYDDDEEYCD